MAILQTADRRPSAMVDSRVRRIGIYGARGAGKTCYLACLYGRRVGDGASVTFTDDATLVYLGEKWSAIKKGRLPSGTPTGRPDELHFRLDADGSWQLCVWDYAGELVQPGISRKDQL